MEKNLTAYFKEIINFFEGFSEDSSYAIQVRIEDSSGSLYFSNTSTNFVVTSGNPSQLDVIVDAVQ